MNELAQTQRITRSLGLGPLHRGWWRSLRVRFAIAISSLIALVLLANALVLVLSSRAQLESEIEARALSFAELAVHPVCQAYETYYASGFSKFRELVSQVAELSPDLVTLMILDTSGNVLFDLRELASELLRPEVSVGRAADDPRLLEAVKGLEVVSWRVDRPDGDRYVIVEPYVEEWGRHRYSVVFEVGYRSLSAATREAAWRILWLAGVSLAVGMLIAFALAKQSLGPVEQLARGARDLAEGKLNRRLRIETGDEFEQLAATFNQMAARLTATIADLEASNRALQQGNEELKELDRLKSDLLANVSHELRTPLTAIQGYAEALSAEILGSIAEPQRKALTVVARNVTRLQTMINELLSYARLESRRIEIEQRPFDLAALADQILTQVRSSRGSHVAIELLAPPGLPEVVGDPQRIGQVLENLLTNAVKFTPAEGRVEVELVPRGNQVEVVVRDSGIGIPAEVLPRIFDRFYQVDSSSTRRYGGIGLGLAIVKEILGAHGVAISVHSEVDTGTTFSFVLPVAREGTVDLGRRVVLIDDDAEFTRRLGGFLAECGFEVRTAGSLANGRALIESWLPDVVLLDRLLPDGDGFDLLAQLKSSPATRDVPVLMVSVLKERGLSNRLGASGYLLKPATPREVYARIIELLGSSAGYAPRVVVATRDVALREELVSRLGRDGIRVEAAADVDGAVAAVGAEIPGLLVVDLALGEGGLWRRLREELAVSTIPAIVLADGEEGSVIPAEIEVLERLRRPLDFQGLATEIEKLVGRAHRDSSREGV
jgi:signal transduction histidine kinase/DNA-binding response OmpR family regulator